MRHLVAGAARVLLRSALLLTAITLPMQAYMHSPRWLLDDVGPEPPSFFVAVRKTEAGGTPGIVVRRYEPRQQPAQLPEYHLDDGYFSVAGGPDVQATVEVRPDRVPGQLVRVFVTGGTPWAALSEYRVVDNRIQPLRHAHSSPWLLLGIPFLFWLFRRAARRVDRALAGWVDRKPS